MAGSADLLRSVRAGGSAGTAAARELVRRALTGALAPTELREVQKAADSPELRDVFREVAKEAGALTGDGELVFRDVDTLRPDTARLTDGATLPERFLGDLTLLRGQLLDHPGLTGQQQAERLFAFFEAYAQRFGELSPQLSDAALTKAFAQFEKALERAKFREVTTDDGRTGFQAAQQMLEAKTPEALRQAKPAHVDAPTWKTNAAAPDKSLRAEVDTQRRAVAFDSSQVRVQPHVRTNELRTEAAEAAEKKDKARKKSGNKVLGSRMMWNVLHLMRGEDLDDVAKADAMTQLAIAAGLLLCFGAIVVGILVWL